MGTNLNEGITMSLLCVKELSLNNGAQTSNDSWGGLHIMVVKGSRGKSLYLIGQEDNWSIVVLLHCMAVLLANRKCLH